MTYLTMFREENCCDFPHCDENFTRKKDIANAIERDGKTQAFCELHSLRLQDEGVPLRKLSDIHAEKKAADDAKKKAVEDARRIADENAFIKKLKGEQANDGA